MSAPTITALMSGLDFTSSFSSTMILTTGADVTTTQGLYEKWGGAGNRSYRLQITSGAARLLLSSDGTATSVSIETTASLTINTKHALTLSYDASAQTMEFFLDEVSTAPSVVSGAIPASIFDSSAPVALGTRLSPSSPLGADISSLVIATDTSGSAGFVDPNGGNVVTDWNFQNSDLTDSSGNGNDLTGNNISAADFITGDIIPAVLRLDFQTEQYRNKFAIDRTNNLLPGDKINLYFSNVSYAVGDSAESYSKIITTEDKPIIIDLDTSETKFRYARVEIRNNQVTKLSFNEINWLAIGTTEDLSKDYQVTGSIGDPSEIVANADYIGDQRFQRRSQPFRTYSGNLVATPETERTGILLRLIEYASNGFPFLYCYDNSTDARELEHLRVVKWLDAAANDYSMMRQNISCDAGCYEESRAEHWDLPFNLKEVGTIAIPYTLPEFSPSTVDPYSSIASPLLVVDDGTGCGVLTECGINGLFETTTTSTSELITGQITIKPSAAQVASGLDIICVSQFPAIGITDRTLIQFALVWDGVGYVARWNLGSQQITMPTSYRSTTEEVTFKFIHDALDPSAKHDIWAVDHPTGNSSALTEGQPISNAGTAWSAITCGHCIIGAKGSLAPLDYADPASYVSRSDADTLFSNFSVDPTYTASAASMTEAASDQFWSLGVNPILSTGTGTAKLIVTPNCVVPDFRS